LINTDGMEGNVNDKAELVASDIEDQEVVPYEIHCSPEVRFYILRAGPYGLRHASKSEHEWRLSLPRTLPEELESPASDDLHGSF